MQFSGLGKNQERLLPPWVVVRVWHGADGKGRKGVIWHWVGDANYPCVLFLPRERLSSFNHSHTHSIFFIYAGIELILLTYAGMHTQTSSYYRRWKPLHQNYSHYSELEVSHASRKPPPTPSPPQKKKIVKTFNISVNLSQSLHNIFGWRVKLL